MEPGMRSVGPSGVLVKNRNSSGCLIVRKKGEGVGSSSASRKPYELNRHAKRPIVPSSDSESSDDELPMPSGRRLSPESIRACNGLTAFQRGMVVGGEHGRKRDRVEQMWGNREGLIVENGFGGRERKRGKVDLYDLNDYDSMEVEKVRRKHFDDNGVGFGGGRSMGSVHAARGGIDREFETGSSRHIPDKRKNSYHDRQSGLYSGDNVDRDRFKPNRDGAQLPLPLLREKLSSDGIIRIQGKNGVLKVMVNKRKVVGPLEHHGHHNPLESRQRLSIEGTAKRNIQIQQPLPYQETKPAEKPDLLVRSEKKPMPSKKSLSSKDSKGDEWDSDKSHTSLNPVIRHTEAYKSENEQIPMHEKLATTKVKEGKIKRGSGTEKQNPGIINTEACKSEDEQTPMHEKLATTKVKEGKIKRGSGTEKQKLRERIREMLLNAGWTIDYRPRRNRDYLDAVYINPTGTAYWSIIKAYDALQKQLNVDVNEAKPKGDSSSFAPITDDVLSQLTRKTRKKMEKELKNKKNIRYDSESDSGKEPHIRRSASNKHDMDIADSDSNEDKLSTFIKQGSKPMKNKMIESTTVSVGGKSQNATHHSDDGVEKSLSGSDPLLLHGRKSRKQGRCTLLVRGSNKGSNSESDGFVPYTGKRTVLSWLIDSGTVQLSQKVQYRRRKRVLLEGWITRDGIHCGCCSKILTVSKFELHAGSKLPQPYQNIYLESGISLLQCQIDAWNAQENSEKIAFHAVDIDGDDPNDDTCGLCGDGGNLICCDGCPSTFHQSCLDIQMLPLGEWHCPNCTCKFCGIASVTFKKEDATMNTLRICNLCEKKYHDFCSEEKDALPNSNMSDLSFCGKGCKELFEHLKKYLGAKHELDAGFSWSLIHRTNEDSEEAGRGMAQRVECNSKLAIALSVMDECFLPVVDRRSGVNIIRNVLYNYGSNFSRLNFSGFYTAILERGDEIISAASIRFRGTKLAEMPFIGTRYIYRRQGMCRRLFSAIELALCSLKFEKLVIPAIPELQLAWKEVFGFTHLEESLRKEIRSLNMLVFPGIDLLQKLLAEQGKHDGNTSAAGSERQGNGDMDFLTSKMANRSDMDASTLQDPLISENSSSDSANETTDELSDASQELYNQVSGHKTISSNHHSDERLSDSDSDKCVYPSSTYHGPPEMKNEIVIAPAADDNLHPSSTKCQFISQKDSAVSDSPEIPALVQETVFSVTGSAENQKKKCHSFTAMNCAMNCDSSKHDINTALDSDLANNTSKVVCMNDAHEVPEAVPSGNLSEENISKENDEDAEVAGSFHDQADESLLHVRSDCNGEFAYEEEKELHLNREAASKEMRYDESGINASGESSETDPF